MDTAALSSFGTQGQGLLRFQWRITSEIASGYVSFAQSTAAQLVRTVEERLINDTSLAGLKLQRQSRTGSEPQDVQPAEQQDMERVYVDLCKDIQRECLRLGYCVVRIGLRRSQDGTQDERVPYVVPYTQYSLAWAEPPDGPRQYVAMRAMGDLLTNTVIIVYGEGPMLRLGRCVPNSPLSSVMKRLREREELFLAQNYVTNQRAYAPMQSSNDKAPVAPSTLEMDSWAEGTAYNEHDQYQMQQQSINNNIMDRAAKQIAPARPLGGQGDANQVLPTYLRVLPLGPGNTLELAPAPDAMQNLDDLLSALEECVYTIYGIPPDVIAGANQRRFATDSMNVRMIYNITLLTWQRFLSRALTRIYNELDEDAWSPLADNLFASQVANIDGDTTADEPSEQKQKRRLKPADELRKTARENLQAVITVQNTPVMTIETIVHLQSAGLIRFDAAARLACAAYGLPSTDAMTEEELQANKDRDAKRDTDNQIKITKAQAKAKADAAPPRF